MIGDTFEVHYCLAVHPVSKHWRSFTAVQVNKQQAIVVTKSSQAMSSTRPADQSPIGRLDVEKIVDVRSLERKWGEEATDQDFCLSDPGTNRYQRSLFFENGELKCKNFEGDIDYTPHAKQRFAEVMGRLRSTENMIKVATGELIDMDYVMSRFDNFATNTDVKEVVAGMVQTPDAVERNEQPEIKDDHPAMWGSW